MSYANATASPADRARAAVSVVAIHALIGAGVVIGLTVTGGPEAIKTIIEGRNIPEPPPPPPPPDEIVPPEAAPVYVPPAAPRPPVDLTQPAPIRVIEPIDTPDTVIRIPSPIPTPAPIITPSASPSFAPAGPVPRNGPGGWISNNDYPSSDLRRGNEGTANYRLVVGSNGRVDACEITSSTGHASLDRTTCRLIERRARFDAATDGLGERVVGTFTGAVTWRIPD